MEREINDTGIDSLKETGGRSCGRKSEKIEEGETEKETDGDD